jgi:hypothetical protein
MIPGAVPQAAEAQRLMAIERRLLHLIQCLVFGGVILLTVGAGALSWTHLTHIAATNGHIAPGTCCSCSPPLWTASWCWGRVWWCGTP